MNVITQAAAYLLIANLALPGAGCECLGDEYGAMKHSSDHMSKHEPTHGKHTTSHHAQDQSQAQQKIQNSNQALDAQQTHNCLIENCSVDGSVINEAVAASSTALLTKYYRGEKTEAKYTAHIVVLTSFDIARAPSALAPPQNRSYVTAESPFTRFDRLII